MKNKIYIMICLFLSSGLASCNDWLDVEPKTQETLDEMFSKQQGYQDVLIGSYLKFKSDNLYGKHMTFGNIEFLAQHWEWTKDAVSDELSHYNYKGKNSESAMSSIFETSYKVVAELNMMLQNMEEDRGVFEKGMYEIIKGEALAMRAFCHFDLLRLFGPMPTNVSGKTVLPYVKKATLEYHEHLPYQQYIENLEQDMKDAEVLLKETDPIVNKARTAGLTVAASDFLKDRQLRFNYYAVKAMQARFYLWVGGEANNSKAFACAKEVLDAVDEHKKPKYSLASVDAISNDDFSFSSEHILALHDYKLYEKAKNNFTGDVVFRQNPSLIKTDLYTAGTTDIRLTLWTEEVAANQSRYFTVQKYIQPEKEGNNQIPLIRLSEMYFIAMECGSLDDANTLYKEFCIQRDITPVRIESKDQLMAILLDEYNKEFYGEGQMFYTYKRLAVENILWSTDEGNEDVYVVPLPKNEVSYN